jgi:hypothetical protein
MSPRNASTNGVNKPAPLPPREPVEDILRDLEKLYAISRDKAILRAITSLKGLLARLPKNDRPKP